MVSWIFEPDSFIPATKIVDNKRYSIITDHIGTPIAMFDEKGNEAWALDLDIYGQGIEKTLVVEKSDCPFRFQGQYCEEHALPHIYKLWR